MRITIENTTKLVSLNGVPARVWEGQTATGIPVIAYVTFLQVERSEDHAQFERELVEMRVPSAAVQEIPGRLVLG